MGINGSTAVSLPGLHKGKEERKLHTFHKTGIKFVLMPEKQ
jgi:hypothetical protein